MCNKAVSTYPFTIQFVTDRFKTQEMDDKAANPFMLNYCPDKYKTQEMCNKAVDSCWLALKFVRDWFVTNKMIEKPDSAIFFDDCLVI